MKVRYEGTLIISLRATYMCVCLDGTEERGSGRFSSRDNCMTYCCDECGAAYYYLESHGAYDCPDLVGSMFAVDFIL